MELSEQPKSNKSQTQRSLVPCATFVPDSTRLGLRGENWGKKSAPLRLGAPHKHSTAKTQRSAHTAEKTPKR